MAVALGELGQRPGEGAGGCLGGYAVVGGVGPGLGHGVVPGTGEELQRSHLVAAVPADQFRRDAVEPGADAGALAVVAGAYAEGGQEGLSGDVVGGVTTEAPGGVLVDGGRIPVEERREALRFVERRRDEHGIRLRTGPLGGPAEGISHGRSVSSEGYRDCTRFIQYLPREGERVHGLSGVLPSGEARQGLLNWRQGSLHLYIPYPEASAPADPGGADGVVVNGTRTFHQRKAQDHHRRRRREAPSANCGRTAGARSSPSSGASAPGG